MKFLTTLLLSLVLANPAFSLVTNSPSLNNTAPPDDPGWDSVGYFTGDSYTVVYLGDGWVMSAGHLTCDGILHSHHGAAVTFHGVSYPWDGVDCIPIMGRNLSLYWQKEGHQIDLAVWHIVGDPGIPGVPFAKKPSPVGTDVILVSHMQGRGAAYGPDINGRHGWYSGSVPRYMQWGTNKIAQSPNYPLLSDDIYTQFDEFPPNTTAYEAQAVMGDSGGIVFGKIDGVWSVIGIIVSLDNTGQVPSYIATFTEYTVSTAVAPYADQISAILGHGALYVPLAR